MASNPFHRERLTGLRVKLSKGSAESIGKVEIHYLITDREVFHLRNDNGGYTKVTNPDMIHVYPEAPSFPAINKE